MAPDARTLHCSSCGAPFAADARFCSHCGAETTLEERALDAICIHCGARASSGARFCMQCGGELQRQATTRKPDDGGCPRCGAAMRERDLASVTIVECGSCGGLWLSPEVFDRICSDADLSSRATRELTAAALPKVTIPDGKVFYLPCPRCHDRMVRKNFGGNSGVIVDVCRNDGIFLDHGELEKVIGFVHAGGLIEARRREVQRLEDEAREAKWKRDFAGGGVAGLPTGGTGWDDIGLPTARGTKSLFGLFCDILFSSPR
jgi:Zn-finger nucleic acid-binding protein/ribosomal protein L40E